MKPLRVFIGYDEREPLALKVCAFSINRRSSVPVTICPLNVNHLKGIYTRGPNGTTAFSLTRFLAPHLCGFEGLSLFMDCDMLVQCDIAEVFAQAQGGHAVWCAQHDYVPREGVKATGIQQAYPRKNWSSVMLFDNTKCRALTPDYVNTASPADLHRMVWADSVGALPLDMNHLVGEYEPNPSARILHYTLGTPCFRDYRSCDQADLWFAELGEMNAPLDYWMREERFAVAAAAGYPVPPRT